MASDPLQMIRSRPASNAVAPPAHLGGTGLELWHRITSTYEFQDPGSVEVLTQACYCISRADRCRAIVDAEGEMLRSKTGVRSHPLLKEELGNRALGARLLGKLGLDLEPVHDRPGRPSGR